MKKLLVCLAVFFSTTLLAQNQVQEFSYQTQNQSYDSDYLKSNVYRTLSDVYVKLFWDAALTPGKTSVEVQNLSTGITEIYPAFNGAIEIKHLDYPNNYSWRVSLEADGDQEYTEWQGFTTAYQSPVKATKEIAMLMKEWPKHMDSYNNIEDYVQAQKHISQEDKITFLMNFYKGALPSLTAGMRAGGGDGEGCNCDFVVFDNVDQGAPEVVQHNDSGDVFCGDWKRSNSFTERHGAAKEMQLHMDGRLKENQADAYQIEKFVSYTALSVQYCCDSDDCCDADYLVGARIDHELFVHGDYDKKGAYSVMAADMSFIAEVKDGEIEMMNDVLNNALEVVEETNENYEFWENLIDLVVDGFDSYEEILDADPDAIEEFLDLLLETIQEDPVIHTNNNGGNSITDLITVKPLEKTISPNEVVNYCIVSSSALGYTDAWGKKTFCNKGNIDVDGHVKTGYSLAISSIFKDDKEECCRNDYAKWVTGSYIADGANAQNMIAEAGLTVGCNEGKWTSSGVNIPCPNSNPVLLGPLGIATADNECCEGGPVNPNFTVTIKCVEGQGEGEKECVECDVMEISISISDCNPDNTSTLLIREVTGSEVTNVWWDNDASCTTNLTLALNACSDYILYHTVSGECAYETQAKHILRTCCRNDDGGGDDDGGDKEEDGKDDNPGYNTGTNIPNSLEFRSSNTNTELLTISPNPASELIHFNTTANSGKLEIYNLNGSLIHSKNFTSTDKLTLQSAQIGKGTFIARVSTKQGTESKKFIILE